MSELTLTDADDITLETFYDGQSAQVREGKLKVDRWTNYGHDRLYINAGISKCDKHSLYVDLQTHEIVSDNEGKHKGGDVEINGDTAEITIIESGVSDKKHVITVSLEGDGFESGDEDGSEGEPEIVTDGGKDVDLADDSDVEAAIEQHDDPDHKDAYTVDAVQETLAAINANIIDNIDLYEDAMDDGAQEVVYEDSGVLVLADHTGQFWNEQLDAMGIQDDHGIIDQIVSQVHHDMARKHCDYSWSAVDPAVIHKPDQFVAGESHMLREIARRTEKYGSVARAVDTIATDTHGWDKGNWATTTGRNPSTVTRTTDN